MDSILQIFKALSDETRLKILIILSRKNICAKGLSRHLGISEAAVSQHIKVLREANIIRGEKIGYYVHYDLKESFLKEINRFMKEIQGEEPLSVCQFESQHILEGCNIACNKNKNKCCEKQR